MGWGKNCEQMSEWNFVALIIFWAVKIEFESNLQVSNQIFSDFKKMIAKDTIDPFVS